MPISCALGFLKISINELFSANRRNRFDLSHYCRKVLLVASRLCQSFVQSVGWRRRLVRIIARRMIAVFAFLGPCFWVAASVPLVALRRRLAVSSSPFVRFARVEAKQIIKALNKGSKSQNNGDLELRFPVRKSKNSFFKA